MDGWRLNQWLFLCHFESLRPIPRYFFLSFPLSVLGASDGVMNGDFTDLALCLSWVPEEVFFGFLSPI